MRPTNLGGREKLNQPAGGRHHILLEACQFYNVENGRIIEKNAYCRVLGADFGRSQPCP